MTINKLKIGLGIFGTGLTAGGGVLLSSLYSKNQKMQEIKQIKQKIKLGEKYKSAIIDEDHMWGYRFRDLKKGNPKNGDLLIAKGLDSLNGTIKLQETCQTIISSNEDSDWFDDFQNFCVMKNKDESKLINNESGFDSKYSIFSKFDLKRLSKGFAEIWLNKENEANDNWRRKILSECKRLENKMFVGDLEDDNFGSFCVLP